MVVCTNRGGFDSSKTFQLAGRATEVPHWGQSANSG